MTRRMLGYAAALFFVCSAVFLPVAAALESKDREMQRSEILSGESSLAEVSKTIMSQKMTRLVSDLLYIGDSLRLCREDGSGYDGLKKEWIAFSNRKKVYDQIRYIDKNGSEVLRINYAESGAYAVADGDLQNKSDRPYFTDTMALSPNQIYISRMDLNVEGTAVEQPVKPMIRLSAPYYDTDGSLAGIVILNYYANDILSQLQEVSSTSRGSVYLLNAAGYWLYDSTDADRAWSFMYPERQEISFAKEYPAEWQGITAGTEVQVTKNGLFHCTNLFSDNSIFAEAAGYSFVLGDGDFYLVSQLSADTADGRLFTQNMWDVVRLTIHRNGLVFLLFALLSGTVAVFLDSHRRENEQIRYFSEYDTMTGIYNRRAGFEKLQQLYQETRKTGEPLSLCFVDINGLKEVNDGLGHEAGDELIRSVVEGIRRGTRKKDLLARLGGDEFLIVLPGMAEQQAEEVWKRISAYYAEIDRTENRPYHVSASHGVDAILRAAPDDIDLALNRADQKMYEEKRRLKEKWSALRR